MSAPRETKRSKKSWQRPLSAVSAIAGAAIYAKEFPNPGSLTFSKIAVACGVGALFALLGCAVGWVIERTKR